MVFSQEPRMPFARLSPTLALASLLTGCVADPAKDTPADSRTGDQDCDEGNAAGSCAAPYTTAYGSDMLVIYPGTFTMRGGKGDPSDWVGDLDVELTRTFWLGEHEVTQDEWAAWTTAPDTTPSYFTGGNRPVEQVSWTTAALYANALSTAEGLTACYTSTGSELATAYLSDPYSCPGYRLPTEAEFEYAARAGEDTEYAGSDTVGDVAWYYSNSGGSTHDVCTLESNAWGLCDMSGNVWEWTTDWYGGYGRDAPDIDPAGPPTGWVRVNRGGSWANEAWMLRIAWYSRADPGHGDCYLGFRLARSSI